MVARTITWLGFVLVVACGGKTDREEKPDGTESPGGSGTAASGAGGSGQGALDAGDSLGVCSGGFDRDDAVGRHCNWVAGGRCFEDKLDACSCACPKGVSTTSCYSGWPAEDGEVVVYCY